MSGELSRGPAQHGFKTFTIRTIGRSSASWMGSAGQRQIHQGCTQTLQLYIRIWYYIHDADRVIMQYTQEIELRVLNCSHNMALLPT